MGILNPGDIGERITVISPHDDDGIIGVGGILCDAAKRGKAVAVVVMTNGCLGYSKPEEKHSIIATRAEETVRAYRIAGVENVLFFDFPDMGLWPYCCWETPDGKEGGYQKLIRHLREFKPETIFIPNREDIHPDHRAAYEICRVAIWQAQHSVAAEFGPPVAVKHVFVYQVWQPLPAISHRFALGKDKKLGEEKIEALRAFRSQGDIIAQIRHIGFEAEYLQELPASGF